MYRVRSPDYRKDDPIRRWALPDRVFFACGACHILAHAFLERHGTPAMKALWFKPAAGFTGNHIVVASDEWIFDYHGYADRARYMEHVHRKANRWWPGWRVTVIELPQEVLVSESRSRTYDGLWLREPRQFLHDALPRARAFLDRFPAPIAPVSRRSAAAIS